MLYLTALNQHYMTFYLDIKYESLNTGIYCKQYRNSAKIGVTQRSTGISIVAHAHLSSEQLLGRLLPVMESSGHHLLMTACTQCKPMIKCLQDNNSKSQADSTLKTLKRETCLQTTEHNRKAHKHLLLICTGQHDFDLR